jgi:hypothetical protein
VKLVTLPSRLFEPLLRPAACGVTVLCLSNVCTARQSTGAQLLTCDAMLSSCILLPCLSLLCCRASSDIARMGRLKPRIAHVLNPHTVCLLNALILQCPMLHR